MRTVDIRFLTILVVSLLVIGGACHALHEYQLTRQQRVYIREADRVVAEGKPGGAVDFLKRYLRIVPDDVEQRLRLARILRELRVAGQAQSYYTQVIQGAGFERFSPQEQATIQYERATVAMQLGLYEIAKGDLDAVLGQMTSEEFLAASDAARETGTVDANTYGAEPVELNEAEIHEQQGRCLLALDELTNAADAFQAAIDDDTARLSSYVLLAELKASRLAPPKPEEAVALIKAMVDNNSNTPDAYVLRSQLFLQHAGDDEFRKEVGTQLGVSEAEAGAAASAPERESSAEASASDPLDIVGGSIGEDPEPSTSDEKEETALSESERTILWWVLADARTAIELKESVEPTTETAEGSDITALLVRMQAANSLGLIHEAEESAKRAIEAAPATPSPYAVLSEIQLQRDVAEAAETLQKGLSNCGDDPSLLWILANIEIGQDDIESAKVLIKKLPEDNPAVAPYWRFLNGRIRFSEGKWREAREEFEAIQFSLLENSPMEQEARYWLAVCYRQLRQTERAKQVCKDALLDDPTSVRHLLLLAELHASSGELDQAIQRYRAARRQGQVSGASLEVARMISGARARQHIARLLAEERWGEVEGFLSRIRGRIREDTDTGFRNAVDLLEAEVLLARREVDAAEQLLAEASRQRPDEEDLWVARSTLARFRQNHDEAEEILKTAESNLGETPALRLARIQLVAQRDGPDGIEKIEELANPPDNWPDHVDEASAEQFAGNVGQVAMLLLDTDLSADGFQKVADLAEKQFRSAADSDPSNLSVRLLQFDLAVRLVQSREAEKSNDADTERLREEQKFALRILDRVLHEMEGIEGADGTYWNYGKAVKLALEGQMNDEPARYQEALEQLKSVQVEGPVEMRVPMLEGLIYELQGRDADAATAYLQAFQAGARDPRLIRTVIERLYRQGLFRQAASVVQQLGREGFGNRLPELAQHAYKLSRITDDRGLSDLAFDSLARRIESSEEPADHLIYGQLLQQQNRFEEATKRFEEAVRLAPGDSANWLALVGHLVGRQQDAEARERLSEAAAAMADEYRLIGLARGHEILAEYHEEQENIEQAREDLERARSYFDEAIEEAPDDADRLRTVAVFHLRQGNRTECEDLLNRLLEHEQLTGEDRRWGRRSLAVVLMTRGTYVDLQNALKLADENLQDPENTGVLEQRRDQRLKAMILSRWPTRESRKRAIDLYEHLIRERELAAAADRAALANLYLDESDFHSRMADRIGGPARASYESEADRNLSQALDLLRTACGDVAQRNRNGGTLSDEEAGYFSRYIEALLDNEQVSEAHRWARILERYVPGQFVIVSEQAEIAFRRGEHEEVRRILSNYLDGLSGDTARNARLQVARRFEGFSDQISAEEQPEEVTKYLDAAEKIYDRHVEAVPDDTVIRAGFLARHGRVGEALEVIDREAAGSSDDMLVSAATAVLEHAREDADSLERLNLVLGQAVIDRPESLRLKLIAADASAWKRDGVRALALYQEVCEQNPDDVVAANNVAFLLALQGRDVQRALQLINHAIELQGPVPALLDTRAVVLMGLGLYDEALEAVANAEQQEPSGAYQMRRAQILLKKRRMAEARASYANARAMGYSVERHAHPLERDEMSRLQSELQ